MASNILPFMIKHKNKLYPTVIVLLIIMVAVMRICNDRIVKESQAFIYDNVDSIPKNRVGLLLGTSKKDGAGYENLYFKYRIEAAVQLYKAGKIDRIIVSGDGE